MNPTHPDSKLNLITGDRNLSAWQPVRGVTWIQSRDPKYAEKLRRRSDSRLVVRGVSGGYLRTFEFLRPISWAKRLIKRYTANPGSTNEPFDHQD